MPPNLVKKLGSVSTGNIGELMVTHELMKRGWDVCVHAFNSNASRFDLVAAKGQLCHRIQVKACGSKVFQGHKNNKRVFAFTTGWGAHSKRKYSLGDFDFMVLVSVPVEDFFILPAEVASQVVSIKIAVDGKYWAYRNRWEILESSDISGCPNT
ncbi:group I intron-associated PD-(D/E)XK endonuclease [uncultured Limnobacter sp.]|uniref:group I intron-associated PD-(D/E)XK endonuclease n=1 Tax=uncultured Limnobacter sp. TaxID=199681 RepID=UPI0032B2DB33